MSIRVFLGWLLVAVASVVAAVAVVVSRPTSSIDPLSREPVFTELRANPDNVGKLTVKSRFASFTFVRDKGDRWRAPDKYNYPVDESDVRKLVVKLTDMRYIERKTSMPSRFKRLDVNDITDKLSDAVYVRVATPDDKTLAEAIVGRPSARFLNGTVNGTYIRFPKTNKVWLVSGAVNVQTRLVPWLERKVVSLPADTVKHVVLGTGKDAYEVIRKGKGDKATYTVPQVPKGRELKDRVAENITRSVANLTLEDVKPRSDLKMPDDAKKARFETTDGIALDLTMAEVDKKPWMTLVASYTGDPKDDSDAAKAARKHVEEINDRAGKWVYWVASDLFDRLTAPLDKQLAPEKKKGQS